MPWKQINGKWANVSDSDDAYLFKSAPKTTSKVPAVASLSSPGLFIGSASKSYLSKSKQSSSGGSGTLGGSGVPEESKSWIVGKEPSKELSAPSWVKPVVDKEEEGVKDEEPPNKTDSETDSSSNEEGEREEVIEQHTTSPADVKLAIDVVDDIDALMLNLDKPPEESEDPATEEEKKTEEPAPEEVVKEEQPVSAAEMVEKMDELVESLDKPPETKDEKQPVKEEEEEPVVEEEKEPAEEPEEEEEEEEAAEEDVASQLEEEGESVPLSEELTAPRELSAQEVAELTELLKATLNIETQDDEDDAENLLDYALDMINNGESVGHVTEEVSNN